MQLKFAPVFLILALVRPILTSPIALEIGSQAPSSLVCYPITNNSPTVANIIAAENKLIIKGGECYQGDTYKCQDHSVFNGAKIQICGYPLWHAPCWALASLSKKIRAQCTWNGRAAGHLELPGNSGGKLVVG
ncbi:hypothetical protein K440DRAFT_672406 [Wilcoxina mikolae CBS 423.85]|nr:hypothetical protein K440DRAFT_672406 [Wilcoxina mikolae CBS 423.85]